MEIPITHYCPIAKATQGLIEVEPKIITQLAGAVWEPNEWLVILLGTKSQKGLHVIVEEIYVPRNQIRDGSTCEVPELPNELNPYIVGALHSHHRMGAKFSGQYGGKYGDRGEDGLNVNFPMSIVISSDYSINNDEAIMLGFDYEAELTFEGPCGGLLTCEAFIIPRGIADWPFAYEVEVPSTTGSYDNLHDCQKWKKSKDSTLYQLKRVAKCGLEEATHHPVGSVFGTDYNSIVRQLPKIYSPPPPKKGNGKGKQRDTVTIYEGYRDESDKGGWEPYDEFMAQYNSEREPYGGR